MPRILRTRASRLDYDEIWGYVAVRDLAAADRLVDKFDATLKIASGNANARALVNRALRAQPALSLSKG